MSDKPPIVKTTDEARQGETSGRVRWVPGVSITAVIVLMVAAYFIAVH